MDGEIVIVEGQGHDLRYPDDCACCGIRTETQWDGVPYCRGCRAHVRGRWRRRWLVGFAAVVIGTAVAIVLYRFAPLFGLAVHVGLTAVAAAVPIVVARLVPARRLDDDHACADAAVEFRGNQTRFRHAAYGQRVAWKNDAKWDMDTIAVRDWTVVVWIVACALPLAGLIWMYPRWHMPIWIDNGGPQPITIRVDGHEVVALGPDERTKIRLPRGAFALDAIDARGAIVDHIDITAADADADDTLVFDVGATNCYELVRHEYRLNGAGFTTSDEPRRLHDHLLHVRADLFFAPAPAQISVAQEDIGFSFLTTFDAATCR